MSANASVNRKNVILGLPAPVVTALPAQNTNNNTASIDLGDAAPGASTEAFDVRISVPALPALADGQTVTLALQDSADNASFAAIGEFASFVRTGAGGAGAAAADRQLKLPATVRRYIRLNQAASATAGNNTGVSTTLSLVG